MKTFRPKSLIYLPADHADGVLLLGCGRAKICTFSGDGKETILAFVEPGELFGELAIVGQETREEYAEACETSKVVLIPADAMQELMQHHPYVSLGIMKLIGLRRQRVERRLKYLLFRSNRERLVHLLLELTEQYGTPDDQGVRLRIKFSHRELANIIGSTRESVTILLGQLQAEGHLRLGRRKIIIRDPLRLAQSVRAPMPRVKETKKELAGRSR